MSTTTNLTAFVPTEKYQPGILKTFYENPFLSLFPKMPISEGTRAVWRALTDGTSYAAATTEGAAAPSADVGAAIQMYVAMTRYHVAASQTHEVRNQLDKSVGDPMAMAVMEASKRLRDLVSTTELAVFEAACDNAGSYGSQTRSSYANLLQSTEETTSASLSIAYMDTAVRTLTSPDRGLTYSDLAVYTAPTLAHKYAKIANQPLDATRTITRAQGAPVDGGYGVSNISHEGIPFIVVPEMTSTTLIVGPKPGHPEGAFMAEGWAPRAYPLGKSGGTDEILIDTMCKLIVKKPYNFYKMTNKS